jgi:hypothetical protein
MKTIKVFYIMSFILFINISAHSQPKDVIYIDIGIVIFGTAENVGFGINYERMLNNNISIRVGINMATEASRFGKNIMLGFPVSAQFFTSANNRLEGGIGTGIALNIKGHIEDNYLPGIVLRAGYRYQKRDSEGKFIKVGLEFPSNMYFSLIGVGYSK